MGEVVCDPALYWREREAARRQEAYGKMRGGYHGALGEVGLAWRGLSNLQQVMLGFTCAHVGVWLLWKIPLAATQRLGAWRASRAPASSAPAGPTLPRARERPTPPPSKVQKLMVGGGAGRGAG